MLSSMRQHASEQQSEGRDSVLAKKRGLKPAAGPSQVKAPQRCVVWACIKTSLAVAQRLPVNPCLGLMAVLHHIIPCVQVPPTMYRIPAADVCHERPLMLPAEQGDWQSQGEGKEAQEGCCSGLWLQSETHSSGQAQQ